MATETYEFKLARKAQSEGGDRYETSVKGMKKPWVVYVPQSISRPSGDAPSSSLTVVVS